MGVGIVDGEVGHDVVGAHGEALLGSGGHRNELLTREVERAVAIGVEALRSVGAGYVVSFLVGGLIEEDVVDGDGTARIERATEAERQHVVGVGGEAAIARCIAPELTVLLDHTQWNVEAVPLAVARELGEQGIGGIAAEGELGVTGRGTELDAYRRIAHGGIGAQREVHPIAVVNLREILGGHGVALSANGSPTGTGPCGTRGGSIGIEATIRHIAEGVGHIGHMGDIHGVLPYEEVVLGGLLGEVVFLGDNRILIGAAGGDMLPHIAREDDGRHILSLVEVEHGLAVGVEALVAIFAQVGGVVVHVVGHGLGLTLIEEDVVEVELSSRHTTTEEGDDVALIVSGRGAEEIAGELMERLHRNIEIVPLSVAWEVAEAG